MGAACSTTLRPGDTSTVATSTALVPFAADELAPEQLELVKHADKDWQRQHLVGAAHCSFEQLARPLSVFREGIVSGAELPGAASGGAAVVVGPVIGRVTDTTAAFLIEVSSPVDVIFNVSKVAGHVDEQTLELVLLHDRKDYSAQLPLVAFELGKLHFSVHGSVCTCQRLDPGAPFTFQLQYLEPNTGYMLFTSNVREADMMRPLRFKTLPSRIESLRLVVIGSYHNSSSSTAPAFSQGPEVADLDPWEDLCLHASRSPEVQLALHVGAACDVKRWSFEALRRLRDHESFCEGPKKTMVRKARDLLRHGCRQTLGGKGQLRRVLAEVASNLFVCVPPVDPEQLLALGSFKEPVGDGEGRVAQGDVRELILLALETYREYFRALWDGSFHWGIDTRRLGRGWHESANLHLVPSPEALALQDKTPEVEQADLEFFVEAGNIGPTFSEEWHIHRYGFITIFMLDIRGSTLTAALAGNLDGPSSLLSSKQWHALEEALADEATQVLVLVCEEPLVLERAEAKLLEEATSSDASPTSFGLTGGRASKSAPGWHSTRREQLRLITMLFQWKQEQYPSREVLLLSGGPGFSTTGDIRDSRLGLSIPVVIAGPVEGTPQAPTAWQMSGELHGGRFSYNYKEPLPEKWSLSFVDVDLTSQKPTVDVSQINGPLISAASERQLVLHTSGSPHST